MKTRTVLGIAALLLAAAIPATSLGQRVYNNAGYGNGYFRSGYSNRGYGYGYGGVTQLRIGGANVYFGPGGGGYGYSSPILGYSCPSYYGGYSLGYGYPTNYGGYLGYGYGYGF